MPIPLLILSRSAIGLVMLLLTWGIIAPGCMTFRIDDDKAVNQFRKNGVELRTYTAKVEGRNLHFVETGDTAKPILFFVHGTPGSWSAFGDYLKDPVLLSRYHMISIDRPGFGYSDFGQAENLARQSELISPLLRKLSGGKPLYLVGHSLGGPMIVKLAADNPQYVMGLVIISGSIDPDAEKPEKWRPVLYSTPLNLLVPGAFKPSNVELWYLKKDLRLMERDYAKVTCPVYFIHGRKDTWVPPSNVDYGMRQLSHSQRIDTLFLEEGNHFIPFNAFNTVRDKLSVIDDIYNPMALQRARKDSTIGSHQ
ncbi:alpha/beta hydrolase [Flavihumibacter rivuli]|uniref:alpha/beta fold hydrolase n=1 Tax=Flavihumibacter rivuli TaxID=2838156 RepID=UPI001BDE0B54|nr:alpha/beta hydrolase [Flavihumibacter rivuli]ULQ55164.1 alpha/beta hydrolase [Flavihumibacter rivuli]